MPSGARRPPLSGGAGGSGQAVAPSSARSRSPRRGAPSSNDGARDRGKVARARHRSPAPSGPPPSSRRNAIAPPLASERRTVPAPKGKEAEAAPRRKAKVSRRTSAPAGPATSAALAARQRRKKTRKEVARSSQSSYYSSSSRSTSPSLAPPRAVALSPGERLPVDRFVDRNRSPPGGAARCVARSATPRTPSRDRVDLSPAGRNGDDDANDDHWRPPSWGHRDEHYEEQRRPSSGKGRFWDGKGKGKGKKGPPEPRLSWGSGGNGDAGPPWWSGRKGKGGGKGGGVRGGGGGGYQVSSTRVHVSNLPRDITEGNLEHLFGQHGHVLGLQLLGGGGGARGQMCAIIRYSSSDDAEASIEALHGQYEVRAGDGPIVVKLAKPNPRWDS